MRETRGLWASRTTRTRAERGRQRADTHLGMWGCLRRPHWRWWYGAHPHDRVTPSAALASRRVTCCAAVALSPSRCRRRTLSPPRCAFWRESERNGGGGVGGGDAGGGGEGGGGVSTQASRVAEARAVARSGGGEGGGGEGGGGVDGGSSGGGGGRGGGRCSSGDPAQAHDAHSRQYATVVRRALVRRK